MSARRRAFAAKLNGHARGQPETRVAGPDGEEFDGLARLRYRQPSWAVDSFTAERGDPDPGAPAPAVLGGRYRAVSGIREAAPGNVYRAVDTRDNSPVIIKQARALVGEDSRGEDSRLRLRNDRRVLQALAGLDGIPRFIDHFRHGDDEYLVTSDCGPCHLGDDVDDHGPYQAVPGKSGRSLTRLAGELARILLAMHGRGVIMRDLSPANVVIAESGAAMIVDLGLSAYNGLHLDGRTPGYAPVSQVRGPPRETDDFHQLGMTLLFAATGLHPLTLDDDPDLPRIRARQLIARDHGPASAGILSAIAGLLSGDDERIIGSARQLAAEGGFRLSRLTLLPRAPSSPPEQAEEVTGSVLADVLDQLDDVVRASGDTQAAQDVSIYTGSAGIGPDLLHHQGRPAVDDRPRQLAEFTAGTRLPAVPGSQPGLFTGMTGADVFCRRRSVAGSRRAPGRAAPCRRRTGRRRSRTWSTAAPASAWPTCTSTASAAIRRTGRWPASARRPTSRNGRSAPTGRERATWRPGVPTGARAWRS